MTSFEKQIINSFFERYVNSSSDPDKRIFIPADKVFPGFETASPDQKESFLEAAASLEKRGIFKLRWLKKRRKQAIRDIECINTDALFRLAGRPFPKAIAKQVKKADRARGVMPSGTE